MARPLDCVVASALRVLNSDSNAMECIEAGTGWSQEERLEFWGSVFDMIKRGHERSRSNKPLGI